MELDRDIVLRLAADAMRVPLTAISRLSALAVQYYENGQHEEVLTCIAQMAVFVDPNSVLKNLAHAIPDRQRAFVDIMASMHATYGRAVLADKITEMDAEMVAIDMAKNERARPIIDVLIQAQSDIVQVASSTLGRGMSEGWAQQSANIAREMGVPVDEIMDHLRDEGYLK